MEAPCALGVFSVKPINGYWVPFLNDAPFPILEEEADTSKLRAALSQKIYGQPSFSLDWIEDNNKWTAKTPVTQWEILYSEGDVQGYYVFKEGQIAMTAYQDQQSAMQSCQGYLAVIWYSLCEEA
jgi:hypothetical protein